MKSLKQLFRRRRAVSDSTTRIAGTPAGATAMKLMEAFNAAMEQQKRENKAERDQLAAILARVHSPQANDGRQLEELARTLRITPDEMRSLIESAELRATIHSDIASARTNLAN